MLSKRFSPLESISVKWHLGWILNNFFFCMNRFRKSLCLQSHLVLLWHRNNLQINNNNIEHINNIELDNVC